MAVNLSAIAFDGTLAERLRRTQPPVRGVELFWLGQAGFILRNAEHCVVIDPYLSDSLAEKYRGRPLAHTRIMPAPIQATSLTNVTHILVTHHHTDHMDGATLAPLLNASPDVQLILPRAALTLASERIPLSGAENITGVNAGESLQLASGLSVHVVRASHETLEQDDAKNYRFLGYVIQMGGITIFHSGDTVPFAGQVEELAPLAIDLALLPVNGRSENLRAQGIPGNMSADESLLLCVQCKIQYMIAHHYGLFDFNTADPAALDMMARSVSRPSLERARLQTRYLLEIPLSAERNE
ncbi:MBL fold metallo-hydrolase [[Erwinia] mediterraneensis]|uniref:MBL fold metallo-hydrolase n=1 Tax=[Erwinia] mediterraneensis TaxID=2161819 RepID=UPI00103091D3|nr:MBL fold metallo-hydrolase [[Erwinia] mediterraneensis]